MIRTCISKRLSMSRRLSATSRAGAAVVACITVFNALGVTASEVMRVEAPVVGVEPIQGVQPAACDVPPPERSAGLVAMLRWDLRERCRSLGAATISGYRVYYEWDGRRFSTVLAEAPSAETIRLNLRVR